MHVVSGRTLNVEPAPVVHLGPPAIAAAPPPSTTWALQPDAAKRSVHPTWFWVGVSATALLGTATIVSGLHTVELHDDLGGDRTNAELAERGRSAELRTNVLLLSTGVVALATSVVGYFVFRDKEAAYGRAHRR